MASPEVTAEWLAEAIRSFKFHYWKESVLQDAIDGLLKVALPTSVIWSREHRLGEKARIDFLVQGVGLEVKVGGSTPKVERQLKRYAEFEVIQGLVLVTNRLRHDFPPEMGGKPLEVVHLTMDAL